MSSGEWACDGCGRLCEGETTLNLRHRLPSGKMALMEIGLRGGSPGRPDLANLCWRCLADAVLSEVGEPDEIDGLARRMPPPLPDDPLIKGL